MGYAVTELESVGPQPDLPAAEVAPDAAERREAAVQVVPDATQRRAAVARPLLPASHLRAWSHPAHKTSVFQAGNFFRTKGIVSHSSPKLDKIRFDLDLSNFITTNAVMFPAAAMSSSYPESFTQTQPALSCLAYNKPNFDHTKFTCARLLPFFPLPVACHADLSPFTPIICNSIRAPARSLPLPPSPFPLNPPFHLPSAGSGKYSGIGR